MADNMFGPTLIPATPVGPVRSNSASPVNTAMNQQAQAISTPPQSNVIYVPNMQSVLEHPAGPNEHYYFPEEDNNVIWVRDTDSKGQIKNPLTKLTFTAEKVPFGPEANFVTKQEFQKLFELVQSTNGAVNRLMDELGGTKE